MSNPSDKLPEDARTEAPPSPDKTSVPAAASPPLAEEEHTAAPNGLPSYMRSPEDAPAMREPDDRPVLAKDAQETVQTVADGGVPAAAGLTPGDAAAHAASSDAAVSSDVVDKDAPPAHSAFAVSPDGEAFPLPQASEADVAPAYGPSIAGPDGEALPPSEAAVREEEPALPPASEPFAPSEQPAPAGRHGFAAPLHDLSEEPGPEPSRQVPPAAPPRAESAKRGLFPSGKKDKKAAPPKSAAPRPSLPAFHKTHPVLMTPQTMPPSVWSRLFNGMALLPLLPLTLLLLLQVCFTLDARGLWYLDEVRYADVFQNLLQHGQGVILSLDGAVYADKPPLYFWFLRGLYEFFGSNAPWLLFVGTAVSALLYLWSALGLGSLACRVDGRTNSAAGIILLSSVCVMGAVHAAGMDMLFAALVVCSHTALYRAFVAPGAAYPGMILAFILAGLAVLVNGLLGLLLPVGSIVLFALWRGNTAQVRCIGISTAALLLGLLPFWGLPVLQAAGLLPAAQTLPPLWSLAILALPVLLLLAAIKFLPALRLCAALSLLLLVALYVLSGGAPESGFPGFPLLYVLPGGVAALFLLWQATPQRLFRLDFYIGLAAGLAVIGLWPAAIYFLTGNVDFILRTLPQKQVLDPILGTAAISDLWSFYLLRLPFLLLPWTLLLFFLPWHRLLGRNTREGLAASRRPEKEGLAFLWCMSIAALALLSVVSAKNSLHLLPALPALALLAGRAVLGLEGRQALLFRLGMAVLLFLAGVLTVIFALMLFGILPMPLVLSQHFPWTLPSHGGFFVAGALLLLFGAVIWLGLSSSRPEGVLALLAIAAVCLGYPLGAMIAAPLDPYRSPEAQALMLRAYAQNQYTPIAYNVEPGTYSYYSGFTVRQMPSLQDASSLAAQPQAKVVLALPVAELEAWADKPEGLGEVHRQWLGTRQFALLASPPLEGLAPAQPPFTPAPNLFAPIYKLLGISLDRKPAPPAPAAPVVQPPKKETPADAPTTAPDNAPDSAPGSAGAPTAQPAAPPAAPSEQAPEPAPAPSTPSEEPAGPDAPATAPDAAPETTPDAAPTPSDAPSAPDQPAGSDAAAPPADAASPVQAMPPDAAPETAPKADASSEPAAEPKTDAPSGKEAPSGATQTEAEPDTSGSATHPATGDSPAPAEPDEQGAAQEESAAAPEHPVEPAAQPAAPMSRQAVADEQPVPGGASAPAETPAPVDSSAPAEEAPAPSSEGTPVAADAPQNAPDAADAASAHSAPTEEAADSADAPDESQEAPSAAPSETDTAQTPQAQ